MKTFFESYHGLAAQYGSTLAANCASCHGVHKILPSTDPRSSIYKTNLVETCGKCHPGATENFAQSKVHVDAAATSDGAGVGEQINRWVRRIYLVLIFGTIGFMLVHNLLLFGKKVRARYRAANLTVLRMSLSQRTQHVILAVSFIALAVTGFALKFPDSWIGKAMGSNEMFRRWSHRIAEWSCWWLGLITSSICSRRREGRQLVKDFLPVKKDLKDVTDSARYLTGLSAAKPKIGRFGYAEKMEYWAVVWGTIIMGVTGLMIWFKMDVTQVPAALGGGCRADDPLLRGHPGVPGDCGLALLPRHLRSGRLSAELGLLERQGLQALAGRGASARPDGGSQVRSFSAPSPAAPGTHQPAKQPKA